MSFILDALKKSESERQQQTGAEFASVPTGTAPSRRNTWAWYVGALLLINLAVMLGILLRPAAVEPEVVTLQSPTPIGSAPPEQAAAPATSFADQVAAARETRPDPVAEADTDAPAAETASQPVAPGSTLPVLQEPVRQAPAAAKAGIPTIDELRRDGRIDLPELRIDIHVFSDDPAERFVFINTVKHREKSVLPEGPAVREIRLDGVLLEHRGQVFLLPRQ